VKRFTKLVVCSLFYYAGLFRLFRLIHRLTGHRLTVLALHRVAAPGGAVGLPTITISSQNFQKLISFVRNYFHIIPVSDYIQSRSGQATLHGHSLILTFDDAYLEFVENARPILAKEGLASVVFVPTAAVDSRSVFWWDQLFASLATRAASALDAVDSQDRMLKPYLKEAADLLVLAPESRGPRIFAFIDKLQTTNSELRDRVLAHLFDALQAGGPGDQALPSAMSWQYVVECAQSGVEIGSHTVNHEFLTSTSTNDAQREICQSKSLLEERLNAEVYSFSYPGGRYDEAVRQLVQSADYACAFTSIEGLNSATTDPFELRRINISDDNLIGPWGKFSRAITAWNLFMRW